MKNENTQQCPKGIKTLLVSVTVPFEAKGRESRTRRLVTTLVPGDSIEAFDKDGNFLFELSVKSHGTVSTVLPLDK